MNLYDFIINIIHSQRFDSEPQLSNQHPLFDLFSLEKKHLLLHLR